MTEKLDIALIQTELHWEDIEKNLSQFDNLISKVGKADIIVLPEMFSTAFSMNTEILAEEKEGHTFHWLINKAKEKGCAICGSRIVKEGIPKETQGYKVYNQFLWCDEEGNSFTYNKRHLFRMANEDQHFSAGEERIIIEYKGWKILPQVCYDLRFPVWSRNKNLEYDLIIYVANWPEARRQPWMTLLKARAIENLSYVVGVNRIGHDGREIDHSGDSMIIDFKGDEIIHGDKREIILEAKIDKLELDNFREKFPAYKDADGFEIS